MKISAVIGANYGDEGKGLITDYLAAKSKSMVVRFNGGAQAGHTVVTPEGKRHVFHHFGSGTLAGAPTFLSRFFICNPMFFGREMKELMTLGPDPEIYIDPRCLVTTPWDLMLNQAAEKARGNKKHGSCGMGINETVHRNEDPEFSLTWKDMRERDLARKLNKIRTEYVPKRKDQLRIEEDLPWVMDNGIMGRFMEDVTFMKYASNFCPWEDLGLDSDEGNEYNRKPYDLIFEGAQGLRLDMDGKDFPHVTRSKTGITNVLTLLRERNIVEPVDAYYVTRTYLTRHGAGPLENEWVKPELSVVDETNIHNEHQEHLRYAWLDLDQLCYDINHEFSPSVGFGSTVQPLLALTHVDQVDAMKYYQSTGNGFNISTHLMSSTPMKFAEMVCDSLDAERYLMSFGKTRKDVRWVEYVSK